MKLTTEKGKLLKAVVTADSIISSKNINTILANCLFNISEKKMEIISTDNEIALRTSIGVNADSVCSLTLNGKKLSNLLKELPEDEIVIDIDDSNSVSIKTKSKDIKGRFTLIGAASDDYPEINDFNSENSIEIEQKILKEMIKKVSYSASADSIKPVFNGIYFFTDKKKNLTLAATDSRRLSVITREIKSEIDLEDGIIIPLKTVNEIFRLLESSGKCYFAYNNNRFFFKAGETEIISRVVDGQFPNFRQVIPKEHSIEAVMDKNKLFDSVKRTMIFTREPANKIVLSFSKDILVIEARTPELGEASEEINIESNSNENISIGVNAQFLIETLREIDSLTVKCGITGQMSPVTFTTDEDKDYISVIMPIELK